MLYQSDNEKCYKELYYANNMRIKLKKIKSSSLIYHQI